MTELAAAWIDGLLAGTNASSTTSPSSSGATSTSSSPTSSTSSSPAISQPADPEQLQLLSRQVELLERLVALQEATPYGGTETQAGNGNSRFGAEGLQVGRRVVITEPTVARPDFKATAGGIAFAAPSPSPAPPSPAPSNAAYGLGAMATKLPPAPPELAPCVTKKLWPEEAWRAFRVPIACLLTLTNGEQHKCTASGQAGEWFQIQFGNHAWLAAPASAVALEELGG